MNEIYTMIIKLKYFCNCNENRISSFCHISSAELRGISVFGNNQRLTCSELAEKINLSPSRVSRITDNLASKGYLTRQIPEHDRRTTLLCLTKKGVKIKDKINREQEHFEQLLSSKLSAQEIELIKTGLKKLESVLVNNK